MGNQNRNGSIPLVKPTIEQHKHIDPFLPRKLRKDLWLFLLWGAAGLLTTPVATRIPQVDPILGSRMIFGFIGFAILHRWWLAALLGVVLAIPSGSSYPSQASFLVNMLYIAPSMVIFRMGQKYFLRRIRSDWVYAPAWILLAIFCYQAFLTPAANGLRAWSERTPILEGILQGWTSQPYFLGMIMVALVSAALATSLQSTERLELNQQRLDHINRILRSVSNINQLIVTVNDREMLVEEACSQLSAIMDYQNAWITLLGPDQQYLDHIAFSGKQVCQLPMEPGLKVEQLPFCMRQTLQDHRVHIFNEDIDCTGCPEAGREEPRIHLLRSLSHQGHIFGLISISARESHHFDVQEQKLFEEVSSDLEYALHKIRTSDSLNRSQKKYRQLHENMSQGVVFHDHEGIILSVNPAAEQILGISAEELEGQNAMNPDGLFLREDGSPLPEEDHPTLLALRTGRHIQGTVLGVCSSVRQDPVWVLMNSIPIFQDGSSAPYRIFTIFEDISERRLAEIALHKSEARYHDLFESIRDAILVTDMQQTILNCNQAFADLFGVQSETIINQPLSIFYDHYHHSVDFESHVSQGTTDPDNIITVQCTRSNGTQFPAEIKSYPFRYGNEMKGHISLIRDISSQIEAEQNRKRMEDQLRQAQKMETVGQLAGGIAHDFNNMLSIILGQTELALLDAEPQSAIVEPLSEIRQAAERSAELTRQLLAFARKQTIAPIALDLNETIENMLKMLRRLIGENINLAWKPGAETWPIKMDPSQLTQILTNLCVNAREAINDVGHLTIETDNHSFGKEYCAEHVGFLPGDYAMLAVSDSGCGMDHETLDRIFEPFFTTREGEQKTGLGLSMVYGIVKQNNGFINVYSEPGDGTTFRIYLPCHNDTTEEPAMEKESFNANGHGETILLVEDEHAILNLEKTILERLGYHVLAVDTPSAAMETAADENTAVDLLITDVVMPEMNGRQLAQTLIEQHPDMKVLYMSGYTANVIAHRGVLDEGVHFLQKPFVIDDLSKKVHDIIEENQA